MKGTIQIGNSLHPDQHVGVEAARMPNVRREVLDGLRGYAALAVAFYHGILHFDTSLIERVLYQPIFLVDLADLPAKAGITTFPRFAPIQLLQNAPLYAPVMHGPSWSVQVEICAVPFLLAAEGLRRLWGILGLLVALFYGLVAIEYPVLVGNLPPLWPYLFMFFIGMLVAQRPVAEVTGRLHSATWVIALLLFLAGRHIIARAAVSGPIAQRFAGGVLIACVAYRDDMLAAFLRRPVSLFLGRISYSFYLLNVVAPYTVWAVIEVGVPHPSHPPVFWGLVSAITSVLLTLPTAFLSERFVERPCVAAGRSLMRLRHAGLRPFLTEGLVSRPASEV